MYGWKHAGNWAFFPEPVLRALGLTSREAKIKLNIKVISKIKLKIRYFVMTALVIVEVTVFSFRNRALNLMTVHSHNAI
jgi:hypothetical protein